MMYVLIMAVWTTMFVLMILYMKIEIKQAKTIQDWNDKTQIEICANRERLIEIEKRVKTIEHEGKGTTEALGVLSMEVKSAKEEVCNLQKRV